MALFNIKKINKNKEKIVIRKKKIKKKINIITYILTRSFEKKE